MNMYKICNWHIFVTHSLFKMYFMKSWLIDQIIKDNLFDAWLCNKS